MRPPTREVVEGLLDLGRVHVQALRERGRELVAALLVLGLVVGAQLLERGLDLVGADPERVRELLRVVLAPLRPVVAEALAQCAERPAQLGLRDADRLGEVGPALAALAGPWAALGAELLERGLHLGRGDAELVGQRGRECVVALFALGPELL
jgi:hypothetical protein